jgi:hypothetical protein
VKSDPNVKEMDLAAISEKEVFVRKANIVRLDLSFNINELIERLQKEYRQLQADCACELLGALR